mgnify:CR=1 FL=1
MVRVLIVDDTQFIRASLRLMLERHDDIEIVGEADTGTKAVSMYQRLKPDVVTMDISMPSMDGIEAVRRIISADPNAKVCMITSMGKEQVVKESILTGAKGFIVKPFYEDKVVDVLKKLAGKKEEKNT